MPDNNQTVFDPVHNVTHVYSSDGKYLGAENGDISNGRQRNFDDLHDYTRTLAGGDTQTDWGKYVKDNLTNLVPAAVTMAIPEMRSLGVLGNLASRFGLSTAAGSGLDMLLNANNDKTKLQSVVDSTVNAALQVIPDAANIGLNPERIVLNSNTTRNGSSVSNQSSRIQGSTQGVFSKEQQPSTATTPGAPPGMVWQPNMILKGGKMVPTGGGKFVVAPDEFSGRSTASSSYDSRRTATNRTNSEGASSTTREVLSQGALGHLIETLRALKPYNSGTLSPIQRALIGLGLNTGRDAMDRPQQ